MTRIRFAWDEAKNQSNRKKHGVGFEEAQSVFYDENAVEFHDPDHSEKEDRFLMIGLSGKARMILVCYCFREEDSVIRIISARKATKSEAGRYQER